MDYKCPCCERPLKDEKEQAAAELALAWQAYSIEELRIWNIWLDMMVKHQKNKQRAD
jgi:hypothetical protein